MRILTAVTIAQIVNKRVQHCADSHHVDMIWAILFGWYMKRKYHPYLKWEDFQFGMWRKIKDKKEEEFFLKQAVDLTGDNKKYGEFMLLVAKEWKYSCEHNLTDPTLNKLAFIGHAACCLATGCPEYITRKAWWILSKEQRDLANNEAENAIKFWLNKGRRQLRMPFC